MKNKGKRSARDTLPKSHPNHTPLTYRWGPCPFSDQDSGLPVVLTVTILVVFFSMPNEE